MRECKQVATVKEWLEPIGWSRNGENTAAQGTRLQRVLYGSRGAKEALCKEGIWKAIGSMQGIGLRRATLAALLASRLATCHCSCVISCASLVGRGSKALLACAPLSACGSVTLRGCIRLSHLGGSTTR